MGAEQLADIFDPRTYARGIPYGTFRWLREHDPVTFVPEHEVLDWPAGPGFWAVTRYDDVVEVTRTPGVFSSQLGATQIRDPEPADLPFIRRMMLNMDPPEHQRLRRIVSRIFTPRRVEKFAHDVERRARRLIDGIIERGECDFTAEVSDDFPLLNLCDVMGVPEADRRLLLLWTDRIIGYQDPDHAEVEYGPDGKPVNPRSPAALADMFGYAQELARYKKDHPGDDVISALVHAQGGAPGAAPSGGGRVGRRVRRHRAGDEIEGRGLTDAEYEMFFFLVSVAGNDTVRSGVPGGMLAFIDNPGELRRLLDEPDLLPTAVDEVLRYAPPVISFRRTAARDFELRGQQIRRGDKVVVFYASANRDERQFPDPDLFDAGRTPNDHVAFGDGPHVCLGAHFARLQMRIFFREALWRLRDVELAGPVDRLTSNFIAGVKHLPLRFTPGRPLGG